MRCSKCRLISRNQSLQAAQIFNCIQEWELGARETLNFCRDAQKDSEKEYLTFYNKALETLTKLEDKKYKEKNDRFRAVTAAWIAEAR